MTAIIIEDEALAARELESILKKLAPEIEIVARQDSVRGSVQWLKENQVDLIFSDVHLGDGRSFDIFGQVEIKAPVIFITAYDEYALQAFKSQGIDYMQKKRKHPGRSDFRSAFWCRSERRSNPYRWQKSLILWPMENT